MAVFLLLGFLADGSVTLALPQAEDAQEYLVALSVTRAFESERASSEAAAAARALAWINEPLAVLVDDNRDLVLVGRRTPTAPTMTLDEFTVAFRNRHLVGGDPRDSPGVSIDPALEDEAHIKEEERCQVRYVGEDVANTSVGRLFFEVDMLLKLLAQGYEPMTPLGTPSEWDLTVHWLKLSEPPDPRELRSSITYFFPAQVRIHRGYRAAAVQAFRIGVAVEERPAPRPSALSDRYVKRLAADPWLQGSSPEFAFARVLSENFEELARRYRILGKFEAFQALLSLLHAVADEELDSVLAETLGGRTLESVHNPRSVPALRRGVSGFALSVGVSGALGTHPLIYRARAGEATALRELILRYRPDDQSLYWLVPIGKDVNPDRAAPIPKVPEDVLSLGHFFLESARANEAVRVLERARIGASPDARARIESLLTQVRQAMRAEGLLEHERPDGIDPARPERVDLRIGIDGSFAAWPERHIPRDPILSEGWEPSTKGTNLLELVGDFEFGTAKKTFFLREDQALPIDPPTDLAKVTYTLSSRLVFDNRLEFRIAAPLASKVYHSPAGAASLLGGTERSFGSIAGLENVRGSARYLLLDGLWNEPALALEAHIVTPYSEIFHDDPPGDLPIQRTAFVFDGWNTHVGSTAVVGSSQSLQSRFGAYVNFANFEADNGIREDRTSLLYVVDPSIGAGGNGSRLGFSTTFVDKGNGAENVLDFELYFDEPSRYTATRSSVGITILENATVFYYRLNVGADFLYFREPIWF